jgi:hypothetical protein
MTMTVISLEEAAMFCDIQASAVRPRWLRLKSAAAKPARRTARLDLETLPDHMKRDLGFLDGHAPAARDLMRD